MNTIKINTKALILLGLMIFVLGLFTISANAADPNEVKLTLAGTESLTSASVFAANANTTVLDVIANIDKTITNPVYEVNVPKYLGIDKYTLPVDSNGRLQKVEIIDKNTGVKITADDFTKDRILRFTLTPGTFGPIGFTAEISARGYYILPSEIFTLYAEYFNGVQKLYKSSDFILNATNHTYGTLIDAGRGDLEQGKLAQYSIRIYSGSNYSWPTYMKDAEIKVPLPAGAEYVSGDSGIQYVAASGSDPAYLSIKGWSTQIQWIQWKKFVLKYSSATVGQTFTGAPAVLTYTQGGRQGQTFTQVSGVANRIITGPGLYTDHRLKSYSYKIGAEAINSPFACFDFFNNQDRDLTNVNYDMIFSNELRVRGLNVTGTNLSNTTYANLTFTTSFGKEVKIKVSSNTNITPSILRIGGGESITKIHVEMSRIPTGFMLYRVSDGGQDSYQGFVPYGTTDPLVSDKTAAKITVEEYSDQESVHKKSESYPKLYKDLPAQMSTDWTPYVKSVIQGQKITLSNYMYAAAYPYGYTSFHTIVNPTLYYIIPNGFSVKPSEVVLSNQFINKKPNITWTPGVIAPKSTDPNFPNGAGVLKIEFDGLRADSSVTLKGLDDNSNYITQSAKVQFLTQALESTKIGDYPFKPFVIMEAQNTKVGYGWGVDGTTDRYDLNGNNNRAEVLAYTNLDAIGYPNYFVIVTDPLKIDVKSTINSRLTGADNLVEFYPDDLGTYTIELNNRLNKVATDSVAYIPIPRTNANITDDTGKNYTQQWTAQLANIIYTQNADVGYEPQGIEMWYSTSSAATESELTNGTDSGYVRYNTGDILPANVKMVKLKVAQLPKTASVKFILGIKAQNTTADTDILSYMISDYKFIYDGIQTNGKTNGKTLKLIPYKVSGKVFEDINKNGSFDAGEPLLERVPVTLFNGTGTVVQTVNSTTDGTYQFIIKEKGNYKIQAYNKAGVGISFTTPSESVQGSKVDANGQYAFAIDDTTTKELEGIHVGYIINWSMQAIITSIEVPHKNSIYGALKKQPFQPLLRNGELLIVADPQIASAEWDDSATNISPFIIRVTGEKVGTTNLIVKYPKEGAIMGELIIPIKVTNTPPLNPEIVSITYNSPNDVSLVAKASDAEGPFQKIKIQWQYRLVGENLWNMKESDFGEPDTDISCTGDFVNPGQYEIRCRAVDEADGVSDWTDIVTKNIWNPDLGRFTDRVTARNNWITDEVGNKKYNWYFANGDEVVTKVTIKDTDSIRYQKIILDYKLNSNNNEGILIENPQVIQIKETTSGTILTKPTNYTSNIIGSDSSQFSVAINNPTPNEEIAVYIKYKIKMRTLNTTLSNKVLNNTISIGLEKGGKVYSLRNIGIVWPIQLSDTEIKLR